MPLRFPKRDRLCSKKDIDFLFAEGRNVRSGSVSLKWIVRGTSGLESQRQVLIVVPKRNVRKAVDRNRIKRQIREIYRTNRNLWDAYHAISNKTLLLGVIYLGGADAIFEQVLQNYLEAHKKFLKHSLDQ